MQSSRILPLSIAVAIVITMSVLVWYAQGYYVEFRNIKSNREQLLRLKDLQGKITYYDEVLTMSARMAASTGDLSWKSRYNDYEPQLDSVIQEASKHSDDIINGIGIDITDQANLALVAMENLAFKLIEANEKEKALDLLFSDEYNRQKEIYAKGLEQFYNVLQEKETNQILKEQKNALFSFSFSIVAFVFLILVWSGGYYLFRKWHRLLTLSNQQLNKELIERTKAENTLKQYKESLERLVDERTQELNQSNKELKRAIIQAETANKAKSIFLGNVSHELRTPMNAILGYSSMISGDKNIASQSLGHIDKINESGKHLLKLIDDILDVSTLTSNSIFLKYKFFELFELLRDVLTNYIQQAKEKGLQFSLDIAPDVQGFIYTDGLRLRQIIDNLVDNAVKFTETGFVKFNLRASNFSEENNIKRCNYHFEIIDSGIGISERAKSYIFDPFSQQEGDLNRKFEGLGVGLSLVEENMRIINGDLDVKSEPGKGSTFNFVLKDMEYKSEKNVDGKVDLAPIIELKNLIKEGGAYDIAAFKISDSKKEKLIEEIKDLNILHEQLTKSQPIDSVRIFSKDCKRIGSKYQIISFSKYGEELEEAVSNYEVDLIMKLIKKFPGLIEAINKQL